MTDRGPPVGRRRLLVGCGASALAAFAGCGYQPGAGDPRWETGTSGFRASAGWLAGGDDRLFLARNGRFMVVDGAPRTVVGCRVSAFDPGGNRVWAAALGETAAVPPVAGVRGVAVALSDRTVHLLDRETGDELLERRLDDDPTDVAVDAEGVVVATARAVRAFSVRGDERWAVETRGPTRVAHRADGTVLVADGGGEATVRWVDDGTVTATSTLAGSPAAAPRTAEDGVRVLTTGDGLVAFEDDGTDRWRRSMEAVDRKSFAHGRGLCVVSAGDGLVAVDAEGTVRWRYDGEVTPRSPPTATATGVFVVGEEPGAGGTGSRTVVAGIDRETGSLEWWTPVSDEPPRDDPAAPRPLGDDVVVYAGRAITALRTKPGSRPSVL